VARRPQPYFTRRFFLDSNTLARRIVDLVEEKQAADILLLDIREQTALADYFVIATVDNERQASAIQSDLLENLKIEINVRPLRMEGVDQKGSGWVVLDYGDVIIHLFTPEMREHYDLESLWQAGNVVVKVF
jgi:ribosome-associated protein